MDKGEKISRANYWHRMEIPAIRNINQLDKSAFKGRKAPRMTQRNIKEERKESLV